MSTVKRTLIRLHWLFANQFGVDPLKTFRSLRSLPWFFGGLREFRKGYKGPLVLIPCLHDRFDEGGVTKSEYFWQDLLVARWVYESCPQKHVDVGSRVDGFVAHVASFRDIEVLDVRPITTTIPGVVFQKVDLTQFASDSEGGYCDSLSCLHALEHFGLGRYGDPIDPLGHEKGFANMAALLKPGGVFYLSSPIGNQRVEFNANRVFDPRTLVDIAEKNGMSLKTLTIISAGGQVIEKATTSFGEMLSDLASMPYNLGIFVFQKANDLAPRS